MKRCSRCCEEKPVEAFRPRSGSKAHLLRSWCKSCEAQASEEYRAAHPRTPEQAEWDRVRQAQWNMKNAERKRAKDREYYAEHAEHLKAVSKAYRATVADTPEFKAKRIAFENKRRARLAQVHHEPYTREQVLEKHGSVCHLCEVEIDLALPSPNPLSFTLDHVSPISKGGADALFNVRPAHFGCNARKGARQEAFSG